MGVAGVALLGFLVSLVKVIYHSIKYFRAGGDGVPAVVTIRELKEKIEDNLIVESTTYIYDADVLCDGQTYHTEIKEEVDDKGPSKYSIGQEITVRFSTKSSKIITKPQAKEIKGYAISLVGCLLVLVACFVIVALFDK